MRKALYSFSLTVLGLGIAFTIMAHEMPSVYPGVAEVKAFILEKRNRSSTPELSNLQKLRERTGVLPVEARGPGSPISGGSQYGILDVFRTKEIFLPNDRPTEPLRTIPGQRFDGPRLPKVGETRLSNNVLLGTY